MIHVRTMIRQEIFYAHRSRGRRRKGSKRRRQGKQEYWVSEKERRRLQAHHELVRRRSSMLFRTFQWRAVPLWMCLICLVCGHGSLVRLSSLLCSGPDFTSACTSNRTSFRQVSKWYVCRRGFESLFTNHPALAQSPNAAAAL